MHYLLPLLIDADLRIDRDGDGRLGLGSELQLSERASFERDANTDDQYGCGLGIKAKF